MFCPSCQHPESKVVETRASGDSIRRRRQCLGCSLRWTTHERAEVRTALVVKKDGSREPFERGKIVLGLQMACRKRPVSAASIEAAADRIEKVAGGFVGGEIPSTAIGQEVLAALKDLDLVGYLRFASVYQDVSSADEFLELLAPLLAQRRARKHGAS